MNRFIYSASSYRSSIRKKILSLLICCFSSTLLVSTLHAADGLYLGVQAGAMNNDRSGFDDSINLGAVLGYEFLNVVLGDIAIEGGYSNTVDQGNAPGGDWEIETLGAYGVFRSAGPIYIKAKAGVLRSDIKATSGTNESTEFSAGIGGGFSLGIAQFEVEYARIEEDVSFLSLTLNFMTPL